MDAHPDTDRTDPARTETLEARLAALEEGLTATQQRLATAEAAQGRAADELAVLRIVAAYSPRVDSGDAEGVAGLWTEDGVYDVDTGVLEGHQGLADMVRGDAHQGLIAHGCGHVPGLPVVLLDGDRAVATGYTQLVVRSSRPGRYSVLRVTANRWELERRGPVEAPDRGWRVVLRTARAVTDDGEGRALLGRSSDG
ncbi:nuclear transport factor 2 family protein [Rhodococcus sp. IEGM 1408]|uniref:nuclear transport factor 2 family protein n=1 Tax=Rhodococcus sp. IEGM 1408 TaxID=3082220 RepID=UPI0029548D50|nr:nuclear transport factor 2 family protein [Rhodococcus sp. IEGM 1408]MDV8000117.1 nuclear transport factor 2 family protein [Rhodococcus sp. IEGM 1408]